MSTSIIRFEKPMFKKDGKDVTMLYCKERSYPCGLGFELLEYFEEAKDNGLFSDTERFDIVEEVPKDVQYEYVVDGNHKVSCQEYWYASDKGYHGGGFRRGGKYDLNYLKLREENIRKYTIRRPEYWS